MHNFQTGSWHSLVIQGYNYVKYKGQENDTWRVYKLLPQKQKHKKASQACAYKLA